MCKREDTEAHRRGYTGEDTEAHRRGYKGAQERIQRCTGEDKKSVHRRILDTEVCTGVDTEAHRRGYRRRGGKKKT